MGKILLFVFLVISETLAKSAVMTPCRASSQLYEYPKSKAFIKLDNVILGNGGFFYYSVSSSTSELIIQCSSAAGRLQWSQKGRGVTPGVKISETVWSYSNKLKPSCYSSSLIITNVTDQITGEWSCVVENGEDVNKFVLFVQSPPTFYYPEGFELPLEISSLSKPLVLPCLSKRRSSGGISLYQRAENGSLFPIRNSSYNHFTGFTINPKDVSFLSNRATFVCKFDKDFKSFATKNKTLLMINVTMRPEYLVAPNPNPDVEIQDFTPYFSWTRKERPFHNVSTEPSSTILQSEWQELYTFNDFEETNKSASVYFLGSLSLLTGTPGETGSLGLTEGSNSTEVGRWKFKILDSKNQETVGLSYDQDEGYHAFTCISGSERIPTFTFTSLVSDEIKGKRINETFTVTECPLFKENRQGLGCSILTTSIPQGEVRCKGDAVDKTFRYPHGFTPATPSAPVFIERGQTIRIQADDSVLTLPCLPNTPELPPSTHLFRKRQDSEEYEILFQAGATKDSISEGVEFHLTWGFHIDPSSPKIGGPSGTYICTTSEFPEDESDRVVVVVERNNFTVSPKENELVITLPYALRWAWAKSTDLDLDIVTSNEELGTILKPTFTGKDNKQPWVKGELILPQNLTIPNSFNLTLLDKISQKHVHHWEIKIVNGEQDQGLSIESKLNQGTEETRIEIVCKGPNPDEALERDRAKLTYYICENEETCELIKRCNEKNCLQDLIRKYEVANDSLGNDTTCLESKGCIRRVLKSLPLNGILKAVCKYNGIAEEQKIYDVFFREDIHWPVKSPSDLIYLYVSGTSDQNPQREVRSITSNVVWNVGDLVHFSCAASPYYFARGIRWALEDADGDIHFQDYDFDDLQWKHTSMSQILSTFHWAIDSFSIKRVYCFVPSLSRPLKWYNASQEIFLRPEIEDNCHSTEPGIHLISVYPPPSRTILNITETRLDKLPYLIVPKNVLQFAVEVTASEPVEWFFSGSENGMSLTPLIQSTRKVDVDKFYDITSYCYTSKLLVNLRTGREDASGKYVAKIGNLSELSFYAFVEDDTSSSLLGNGGKVLLDEAHNTSFVLPCRVKHPNTPVELFKESNVTSEFIEIPDVPYDPKTGFTFSFHQIELLGNYMCVANGNSSDAIEYSVESSLPEDELQLHREQSGDQHIFKCFSKSSSSKLNVVAGTDEIVVPLSSEPCIHNGSPSCVTFSLRESDLPKYGSIICKDEASGNNASFPLTFIPFIRFDKDSDSFQCVQKNTNVSSSAFSAVVCRTPNECKIMQQRQTVQDETTDCGQGCTSIKVTRKVKESWNQNWFTVFLRCKGQNYEVTKQYFWDNSDDYPLSATQENVSAAKTLRLDLVSFRKQGSRFQGKFRCYANRYFYGRGIQWALERVSGSGLDFSETPQAIETEVQSFNSLMSEINLEFVDNLVTKVYCFAPPLDSPHNWGNVSAPVPIQGLIHPLI